MKLMALLGGALLIAALPVTANDPLRMRVSPEIGVEPAWVTVRISIEPDADNRAIRVIVESDDYFRSSEEQLEGGQRTRTNVFQYRSLPAGTYEVHGMLIGRDGRTRAAVRRALLVMP